MCGDPKCVETETFASESLIWRRVALLQSAVGRERWLDCQGGQET